MRPAHNRHASRQDYETPPDFLSAVVKRFGPLAIDLAAASRAVAKAPVFLSPAQDSLTVDWLRLSPFGNRWLNSPFDPLSPWAMKCSAYAIRGGTAPILALSPLTITALRHANGRADVKLLDGRITFVGEDHAYPGDLMLAIYSRDTLKRRGSFEVWKWRAT